MSLGIAAATLLTWDANPPEEHVERYLVEVETVPANLVELPEVTTISTTRTSFDLGVLPSGDYLVMVRAVNVLDWEGEPNFPPLAVTVPEKPPPPPPVLRFSWVVPIQESSDLREWSEWGETTITIEVTADKGRRFYRAGTPRPAPSTKRQ